MNDMIEVPLNTYEGIAIECPNCGSDNYSMSSDERDGEWYYVDNKCEDCQYKFRVSYRAVIIEDVEQFMETE